MKTEKIRGFLGLARKAGRLAVGSRETRIKLRGGRARLVLLACDGSPRDRERVLGAAREAGVPAEVLGTREELGAAIGRGSVAVVCVTDENLARGMRRRLNRRDGPAETGRENGGQTR